jgi:hypothetical protein
MHLELPDYIAQQEIEVRVELIETSRQLLVSELDVAQRIFRDGTPARSQRAQSRLDRYLVITWFNADLHRPEGTGILKPRGLLDGFPNAPRQSRSVM